MIKEFAIPLIKRLVKEERMQGLEGGRRCNSNGGFTKKQDAGFLGIQRARGEEKFMHGKSYLRVE